MPSFANNPCSVLLSLLLVVTSPNRCSASRISRGFDLLNTSTTPGCNSLGAEGQELQTEGSTNTSVSLQSAGAAQKPHRASMLNVDSQSESVEMPHRNSFGKIVTLRGFTESVWNAHYTESFEPELRINGYNTFWAPGKFIYFCPAQKSWNVVGEASFRTHKRQQLHECPANIALGNGLGHSLHVSTVNAREALAGVWHQNAKAGIGDVEMACGAYSGKETSCNKAGCSFSESRSYCMSPWSVYTTIRLEDIKQGELGTCYFLAALGAVAGKHPNLIAKMFVQNDKTHEPNPAYTTSWMLDGESVLVAVDDRLPVSNHGAPAFVGFSDNHEFWPSVLEKAWAKIYGNFKAAEAGHPTEALKALTSAPLDIYQHNGQFGEKRGFSQQHLDRLWDGALRGTKEGFPMLAASVSTTTNNIAPGHCYIVVGVDTISHGGMSRRVVNLYNPWGRNKYQGELKSNPNSGHFTMLLREYANAFQYTAVAAVKKGYSVSSLPIQLKERTGTMSLKFTMAGSKPFAIMLEWPNYRLFRQAGCMPLDPLVDVSVIQPGNRVTRASRTPDQMMMQMSNVRADMAGGPGEYTVKLDRAKFITAHGKSLNKMTFVVYSSEQVNIRFAGSTLVASSLVESNSSSMPTPMPIPKECLKLYKRLHLLGNTDQIKRDGMDKVFPHDLPSIAAPGDKCGDSAQGISEDCSKYNRWRRFHEIMMGQAGVIQRGVA